MRGWSSVGILSTFPQISLFALVTFHHIQSPCRNLLVAKLCCIVQFVPSRNTVWSKKVHIRVSKKPNWSPFTIYCQIFAYVPHYTAICQVFHIQMDKHFWSTLSTPSNHDQLHWKATNSIVSAFSNGLLPSCRNFCRNSFDLKLF